MDETNFAEEVAKHPSATILNQMLHSVLVSLTNMGTTAFELVKNTKPHMGLDAWRRLSRKFDPNNPTANLRLLRRILQPKQTSLDLLLSAIEQWEQDLSHYVERTNNPLSDEMKRACVQTLCPSDLSTHLDMNITRLDSYDLLKREIERYCEQVATRSGSAPMDISALSRPKGGKERKYPRGGKPKGNQGTGSGPGAGSNVKFEGYCGRCGRWGHKKADCYSKTDCNGKALPAKEQPSGGVGTGKGGRLSLIHI